MNDIQKKYNLKSPAVKRLMREAAELMEPTEQYFAQPLEDNLFEWHFTIRGPPDTEFDKGHYHGKITLPPEYPMKPPSIILLTPNGRFELGKKICLSMSAHHPETWQPSWSIRTVLLALIGFFPSKGEGALGALDYTAEERKVMATRSLDWSCNSCQMNNRTCLLPSDPEQKSGMEEAMQCAARIMFKGESEKPKNKDKDSNPVNQPQQQPAQAEKTVTVAPPESNPCTAATTLRQRTNVSSLGDSAVTPSETPATLPQRRNFFQTSTDYITLGLMWAITIVLLVLVFRRLAMEKHLTSAN